MTKPNYSEIFFLLDRSGSMNVIRDDVIGGVNEFIQRQKTVDGTVKLTLVQFDSHDPYDVVYDAVDVKSIEKYDNFEPRGMTPLLDAMGTTIVKAGERLKNMPEHERPSKVVFVVFTDGYENSSKEYTHNNIKKMVETQTNQYNWQFIFLGADIDAFNEAEHLGIKTSAGLSARNFRDAMNMSGDKVSMYLNNDGDADCLNYSKEEIASLQ